MELHPINFAGKSSLLSLTSEDKQNHWTSRFIIREEQKQRKYKVYFYQQFQGTNISQ
jgi:hypothetical protein